MNQQGNFKGFGCKFGIWIGNVDVNFGNVNFNFIDSFGFNIDIFDVYCGCVIYWNLDGIYLIYVGCGIGDINFFWKDFDVFNFFIIRQEVCQCFFYIDLFGFYVVDVDCCYNFFVCY